ncbi:pimeloyl-ACP methyl ester carboxylesterase [Lipingzhangella halophila]|uniref:Pimeloyl-ACP methyl ester carboxylesterase n=1 Tax=Lipingzhangella halophila TaxID=1783352 RepID=A0A7W7W133_9ACTN|nr:alpha/beta hydrolase [Lipingzhangella halophila]MBB4930211.1 pimeloyl-ACP methyl ester carboxylesterase [Lipingzhangella halophila]
MHAILRGDVSLHYVDDDPGAVPARPPVLLLHGFGSSFELNWERTGWASRLAAEGLRTIGPDLRGHGRSGRPRQDDAYLPGVFVADLVLLLDEFGVERVDVVGYSMGSRLAWEFALIRPERVRRVVMGGFGPRDPFSGTDLSDPGTDDSPFGALFRAVAGLPGNDAAALAACARGQAARPFTPEPAPRRTPLLFVAGENDEMADGVERLARGSDAGVLRVARRDHRTAVPASVFKDAVLEFLTSDEPAACGAATSGRG